MSACHLDPSDPLGFTHKSRLRTVTYLTHDVVDSGLVVELDGDDVAPMFIA